MAPEEITRMIAGLIDPKKSTDPLDSDETLTRLIQICRAVLSPLARGRKARIYAHERLAFTRAMLLIQDASGDELKAFAMDIVDLLWGEGSAASGREARRLDFDKEWEGDTIEEVAFALSRRTFYPFRRAE